MTTRSDTTQAPPPPAHSAIALACSVGIVAVVAVLGSLATIPNVEGWYAEADKPSWTPPDWVFGPVWTVLYLMMAVAAWLVWRKRDRMRGTAALAAYVQQLVLNAAWSPVFFALRNVMGPGALWLAFAIIVGLAFVVVVTIRRFWPISRLAALLLVPYLAWVLYATALNGAIAFTASP